MRIRRKSRITKLGFTFIVLIFLLTALSYSYAMWTETNTIRGSVNTMDDFNYLCLEGYWPLNESTGDNAPDMSMSQNDGTVYGDANWLFAQGIGGCLSFDGNSDYIDLSTHIGDYSGLSEGTVIAWFKTSDDTNAQSIITASDQNNPSSEIRLHVETGWVQFSVRDNGIQYYVCRSVNTYTDGLWHHVAFTVDPSGNNLYVDGNPVTVSYEWKGNTYGDSSSTEFFDDISGLDTMCIGRNVDSGGGQWYFNGLIDEVKIYSCCLSESEIQDIYDEESPLIT